MKKALTSVLMSSVLLASAVGCSSTSSEQQSAAGTAAPAASSKSEATPAASKEKKQLKLWFYFEGKERFDKIASLTQGYSKVDSSVEVVPEFIPFAEFKKRLSVGLAAQDLPDIVVIDNPDHAAYAAMGLFADITDKIKDWPDKDQFYEGPWKSATLNGKVYGIPLGSNNLALFYNKAMLDSAGVKPPQTWDELRDAAKKLSKGDIKGLGFSGLGNEEGTFQFLPWLLGAGATFDKVDSPQGVKAYSYLADLIKDQSVSKEVLNWTQADVMKQFAAGKIAMMVNGPWQIPELKTNAPDLQYGVALLPKGEKYASVLGGENLGVVNGKNVDDAVKFIKYVASPDVIKPFAQSFGYFPSRKDVATDKYWTEDPVLKVFNEEMQYAQPRGPHPKWPEISNALSSALQQTLTLSKTPEEAAKEAQTKINEVLK
ncbi:ABC transporter substrate-binding protein [Paenibacillus hexagrammi]|uniref:ABC transporter substrate-binding protein n=1 Tax=Paenibacillus hexagrammi TaxID=2908839 RepID=A0ABY3SFC7_9BACL|nr:ABC transporter substrate-binding protein [Paenibacillus sp. YPD9-1]UJF32135.1 ABC transporter substrate-binding protein [Paenibacillus sp. YPD9-1]